VAFVTEDRKRLGLFANLSVGQNITLSALDEVIRLGLIALRRERAVARQSIETLSVKAQVSVRRLRA